MKRLLAVGALSRGAFHRIAPLSSIVIGALMTLLSYTPALAAPAQPYRLAVVELRNEARLSDGEIAYLTDQVRSQATVDLVPGRFLIMTRESIVALLPPGKTLADCAKGQCEVEVGRTIGADYIVTGEVLRFGEGLRLNLKVHACQSGAFLGSEGAKGAKVDDLESGLAGACGRLFALVRTHAGVGQGQGSGGDGTVSEGSLGQAPPVWNPVAKKKRVVLITSDPPGAVVQMDGELLCASTPCSREMVPGAVQLQMQKERYTSRREVVTIPAEGNVPAVEWKLAPTFGWLTVRTTPEGLVVTVDGEPAGSSPVVRRELDPGAHEVRLADARYYESGQRVVIVMGVEREVTLAAFPHEGAIEVSAVNAQGDAVTGTVLADGQMLGEVPGTYKILVGNHRIEVNSDAGRWSGDVVVSEHQELAVLAEVKPKARSVATTSGASTGERVVKPTARPVATTSGASTGGVVVKPNARSAAATGGASTGGVVVRGDLMWTVRDNGSDVNWDEAKAYCEACRVGGFSDWRMPTIEELEGVYVAENSYVTLDVGDGFPAHIAKPFQITTPWQWSSTPDGSSSASYFDFDDGERHSSDLGDRSSVRVLCVRRSGN